MSLVPTRSRPTRSPPRGLGFPLWLSLLLGGDHLSPSGESSSTLPRRVPGAKFRDSTTPGATVLAVALAVVVASCPCCCRSSLAEVPRRLPSTQTALFLPLVADARRGLHHEAVLRVDPPSVEAAASMAPAPSRTFWSIAADGERPSSRCLILSNQGSWNELHHRPPTGQPLRAGTLRDRRKLDHRRLGSGRSTHPRWRRPWSRPSRPRWMPSSASLLSPGVTPKAPTKGPDAAPSSPGETRQEDNRMWASPPVQARQPPDKTVIALWFLLGYVLQLVTTKSNAGGVDAALEVA